MLSFLPSAAYNHGVFVVIC